MRGGSALAACALVLAAAGPDLSAHRRDEHLQAARIGIAPDRVFVDLDITPGADLAEAAILAIDRDGDGTLSVEERDAYAASVAAALWLAADREAHALRLVSATFPELADIRRGEGTIALRLRAELRPDLAAGDHELVFGNGHQPAQSVYLANALVPESPYVTITSQRRSATQHELTIGYTLAPKVSPLLLVALVGLAASVLVALAVARSRRAAVSPAAGRSSDPRSPRDGPAARRR
jgi:hypothetical protein